MHLHVVHVHVGCKKMVSKKRSSVLLSNWNMAGRGCMPAGCACMHMDAPGCGCMPGRRECRREWIGQPQDHTEQDEPKPDHYQTRTRLDVGACKADALACTWMRLDAGATCSLQWLHRPKRCSRPCWNSHFRRARPAHSSGRTSVPPPTTWASATWPSARSRCGFRPQVSSSHAGPLDSPASAAGHCTGGP